MPEATQKPFWKKAFWLLLKIYVTLCTLLFSAVLGFLLWRAFSAGSHELDKDFLKTSYEQYMTTEYPKRSMYFQQVSALFDRYATESSSVLETDVVHYLGRPDHVYGNTKKNAYLYVFQPWDRDTNKWFYIAFISEGKVVQSVSGDYTIDPMKVIASNHISQVKTGTGDTNGTAH